MAFSLAVFRDRDAARIFSGQAISQVCDKMMTVGLVWVIVQQGSLKLVPWFLAAGALPHLLLSRPAAGWVARLGALRTVIAADAARAVVFLLAWATWASWPKAAYLFLITLVANCASVLFNPAIMCLPMQLPAAKSGLLSRLTAMVDSCFSLGNVIGPVVAALLYPWIGLAGLFLVNALSYVLAAVLEAQIRVVDAPAEAAAQAAPQARTAGRVAFAEDSLLRFLLGQFFLMNLLITPMFAFLPLFAKYRFAGRIGMLAALETAIGLGTIAGSLLQSVLHLEARTGPRVIGGAIMVSLMYVFFAVNRDPAMACAALFLLGLSSSVINVGILTLFQTRPLEIDVPKVMSVVNLISVGALPISMLALASLMERVDLGRVALGCSGAMLLLSFTLALHPEVRRA